MRVLRSTLAALVLAGCSSATSAAGENAALHLGFDEGRGTGVREEISGAISRLPSPRPAEWKPGVQGSALRLDGFTQSLELATSLPDISNGITVSGWTALEAMPVANAPLIAQYRYPGSGFFLGFEPSGRAYFAVSIDGAWHSVFSPELFPLGRWVHLAGTFDPGSGLTLYVDGAPVARTGTPAGRPMTPETERPLTVGRDLEGPTLGAEFSLAWLNGLVDELRVYGRPLSEEALRAEYSEGDPSAADLRVPAERHAADPHRPLLHAMPPSAWTNEPHGLVRAGDTWHLFFQQNPNGPYWSRIHWGLLTSRDLLGWAPQPPVLAPRGDGFDREGMWSGNAVLDGERLALLYTGVNGAKAHVGLAVQDDEGRIQRVPEPVIPGTPPGFEDFRDPFAWREGDRWYLLIGSGVPERGGTALLYRSTDLRGWELLGPLLEGDRATSGRFWEMPMLLPVGEGRHALFVTTVEPAGPPRVLYWLGTWQNERFTPDHAEPKSQDPLHSVLSPTYATDEGRLVGVGIVPEARSSKAQAAAGWAHTFSLPREVRLCGASDALCVRPAAEVERLRAGQLTVPSGGTLSPEQPWRWTAPSGAPVELELELLPGAAQVATLGLRTSPDGTERTQVRFDFRSGTVQVDRASSSLDPEAHRDIREGTLPMAAGEPLKVRALLDRSIVEVFVNDRFAFATRIYPTRPDADGVEVSVEGGTAQLQRVEAYRLAPPGSS